jgi:alpha-ribazole phosphatase
MLLANYIKENLGWRHKQDDRLMEMNFGDWEMKNWDVIDSDELNP